MKKGSLKLYAWMGLLIFLIAVGVYAWSIQLNRGLIVTGMREVIFWGIYITNVIYFVGLAAGGLILVASVYIFGAERYKPLIRIGEVLAAICVLLAMLFLLPDLGRPDRILNMIFFAQVKSLIFWDFIVLSSYFLFTVIFGWLTMGKKVGPRGTLALSIIGLPLAVSIHSVTAWVFGLVKARPFWHTAILAPVFISSAIVSALGLLILTAILTSKFVKIKIPLDAISGLGKILAVIIPIDLFFLFCEILTVGYAIIPDHIETLNLILLGPYASIFWAEVILVIIAFIAIVSPKRRVSISMLIISSIFVLVAIWLKRFLILVPSITVSPIGEIGRYTPTWVEWTIVMGIYALGMLLYTLATKFLPLQVEGGGV
ncbi:polysulfide reductase NrfD [Candidatus Bathyarchaeota archaeon]|nr:polysulfide reductase NrfD [Candidatus Bathyarchaeota archaeon]